MRNWTLVLLAVIGIVSGNAFGANISAGNYTITSVRVSDATGLVYVKTEQDIDIINSSCTKSDMFAFHNDTESFDQLFAAALSAATASKTVEMWVSTTTNDCLNNRQKITVLEVKF